MPTGQRNDPYRSFNFLVEIDGITRAGFRECSGLDTTTDIVTYREGTDSLVTRQLPGLLKFSAITLRRGITDDHDLWDWREQVASGRIQRKNGSIVLLDDTGTEKARWNFRDGWPTKWTGPSFNATGNEVAIEALEIIHEGLTRA
jgi:phage tail-like protein